jgi:hypothetical protein
MLSRRKAMLLDTAPLGRSKFRGKDFAMSLATWFQKAPSAQQLIAWAVDVARGCHASVAQRLSPAMYEMTLPEARGYIRARASEVVEREVVRLQERFGTQPGVVAVVRLRATEEVIRMAMGDLLKATRQTPVVRKAA